MTFLSPTTLFGLPLVMDQEVAEKLKIFLTQVWWSNYSRSLKDISTDLKACKQFFDPIATGRKLREQVTAVSSLEPELQPNVDISGLVVFLGDDRFLLRPEGRVVIQVLNATKVSTGKLVFSSHTQLAASHMVAELYRSWSMQRLEDVVKLLSGSEPLQPQPLGIALWLLVNRCTSPERAILVKKTDLDYTRRLDDALRAPVEAFIAHLRKPNDTRERKELSLYSAWQLTEVSRRLGPRIVLGSRIYISPGMENEVIDIIATDLRRRRTLNAEQLHNALTDFQTAFNLSTPQLATVGGYFEFPHETQRVLSEIELRYKIGEV